MYDQYYIIEQLVKQRESEIKKMVAESKVASKKPLKCYVPILKQNSDCGCY